jgi:hypothetical protein
LPPSNFGSSSKPLSFANLLLFGRNIGEGAHKICEFWLT